MKLLIDANIVLDALLQREPFCRTATEVLNLTQRDDVREYVSVSEITDIYMDGTVTRISPFKRAGFVSAKCG